MGNNAVRIGTHIGSTGYWGGVLGEVSIYNRPLSPGEIQQNYLEMKGRYK